MRSSVHAEAMGGVSLDARARACVPACQPRCRCPTYSQARAPPVHAADRRSLCPPPSYPRPHCANRHACCGERARKV